MAKKKDEKDVLVVRDEKTGEISVVAGLNADGTPKRTPAKAENAQSFLQFDRHGDVLDNFFKNFFRQCKEPSRFGFYRIAADQAENLLEVMKQLLKDPEANTLFHEAGRYRATARAPFLILQRSALHGQQPVPVHLRINRGHFHVKHDGQHHHQRDRQSRPHDIDRAEQPFLPDQGPCLF